MSVYKIFILLTSNHACVSHLLRGQPHLLECYYRNCLIGTHMCVHPVSEWSVFFTLQCELFTSCDVSNNASLVSAPTGGWGGGQPNVDRSGQGEGGPKKSQICADILYGWPLCYSFLLLRTFYTSIFHYKIDSLEEYSLATDMPTSFTCFKPEYYTEQISFYFFSMVENPIKPRITKSRKNLDKQDKIDLEKQTLSFGLQNR